MIKNDMASRQDRLTIDIQGFRSALETYAEQTHRSTSGVIRLFIEEGLKRHAPHLLKSEESSSGEDNEDAIALEIFRTMLNNESPNKAQIFLLASKLKISPEIVASLMERCGNGDTIRNSK